jgi:hypothetical protein
MAAFGLFRDFTSRTPRGAVRCVAPDHRASAVGLMTMLSFLVGSVSPWLLGRLREIFADGSGLSIGFACLSAAYFVGGLAVWAAREWTFSRDRYREPAV